jgi:hypothetical protein
MPPAPEAVLADGFLTIAREHDGDPIAVLVGPGSRRTKAVRALRSKFPRMTTVEVSIRDAGAFVRGRS